MVSPVRSTAFVILLAALLQLAGCVSGQQPQPVAVAEAEPVVEIAPAAAMPEDSADGAMPETPVAPAPQYDQADVLWIQQRLQDLGYYNGTVNGSVNRDTRNAIRAYQLDQGLEPEGRPTADFRNFMWRNGG